MLHQPWVDAQLVELMPGKERVIMSYVLLSTICILVLKVNKYFNHNEVYYGTTDQCRISNWLLPIVSLSFTLVAYSDFTQEFSVKARAVWCENTCSEKAAMLRR